MMTQLERVSLPVFKGNKAQYPGWWAAFDQCIDKAPVTAEYKLLQLKQCLEGEPLEIVEMYGHSAEAYSLAKRKLEQKYGGKRRQMAIYLDRIAKFETLRDKDSKQFDRFADLLDITVANLIEQKYFSELEDGIFYTTLKMKLTEDMLVQYFRWVKDKSKKESVHSLREWVILEAEYRVCATEIVHGFSLSKTHVEA